MEVPTRYTVGRLIAGVAIALGWVIALGAVVFGIGMIKQGGVPLIIWGAVGGSVNHGLWQMAIALFDIADAGRAALVISEKQTGLLEQLARSAARQPVLHQQRSQPTQGEVWGKTPPHQQDPLPPVPLPNGPRPGETEAQWAKRIEQEDAAAFRRKSGK